RLAVLRERHVTEALAGQRPEVIRVARERLAAVGDRAGIVLRHVPDRRALVPALGELRRRVDQPREDAVSLFQTSALHRLDAPQKQGIELAPSRLMPQLPQRVCRASGTRGIVAAQNGQRLSLGHRHRRTATAPSFTTNRIRSSAWRIRTSASGSPATTTRSARLAFATVPISRSSPRHSAAMLVAAWI